MNYLTKPRSGLISENDTCVIYISEHMRYILRIDCESQLQTKFGTLKALDLVGHPYGLSYNLRKGWVIPLRLTPELWTKLLPHRTQILYHTDVSMILLQLDIKPGSIVVESGTGSGSLSHSILRACLPNGFLYTFDVNPQRVSEARKEFEAHGLGDRVRVECRDVVTIGFGADLNAKADACMLDLPNTWDAIDVASQVLKSDGSRLCTFSPCIEQVQQNVREMASSGFRDVVTLECLLRPFEVRCTELRVWSEEVLDELAKVDVERVRNIQNNLSANKKTKLDSGGEARSEWPDEPTKASDQLAMALSDPKAPFNLNMLPKQTHLHAKQFNETVSHSGYLTFATKRFQG